MATGNKPVIIDLSNLPSDVYVSLAQMGDCKVCKTHSDLRCGVCFDCSPKVDGEIIKPGVHKLWERVNPSNNWMYFEEGH